MAGQEELEFVGVREFKEKVTAYLARKKEVVVTKHGTPVARLVPLEAGSTEDVLLRIGKVLTDAGVTKGEALRALERAKTAVHGKGRR